jgi:hypothetical protein
LNAQSRSNENIFDFPADMAHGDGVAVDILLPVLVESSSSAAKPPPKPKPPPLLSVQPSSQPSNQPTTISHVGIPTRQPVQAPTGEITSTPTLTSKPASQPVLVPTSEITIKPSFKPKPTPGPVLLPTPSDDEIVSLSFNVSDTVSLFL